MLCCPTSAYPERTSRNLLDTLVAGRRIELTILMGMNHACSRYTFPQQLPLTSEVYQIIYNDKKRLKRAFLVLDWTILPFTGCSFLTSSYSVASGGYNVSIMTSSHPAWLASEFCRSNFRTVNSQQTRSPAFGDAICFPETNA